MNTNENSDASSQEHISEEGQSALTAEKPEVLGLHLEVDNPKTGKIKFTTSEKVALELGPRIIVFITLISGVWFLNNMFHPAPPLPPTAEIQPQK